MPQLEGPTSRLMTGVAARDPIEPSLDAAGQREIRRIDRQDQGTVEDAPVEPLRQHEFDAVALPARIDELLPFVDPRELHAAPVGAMTNRRQHYSGLQPLQRLLQSHVLALARTPADCDQQLVRPE